MGWWVAKKIKIKDANELPIFTGRVNEALVVVVTLPASSHSNRLALEWSKKAHPWVAKGTKERLYREMTLQHNGYQY